MNRFYEILGNNNDILEFDSRSYKIKAMVKLRTNLKGEMFEFDYKDISLIQERSDKFLSDAVAGFMVYDVDDNVVLLNLDNILEVSFNKNTYNIICRMVETDDKIKSLIHKDKKISKDTKLLKDLIREKKSLKDKLEGKISRLKIN